MRRIGIVSLFCLILGSITLLLSLRKETPPPISSIAPTSPQNKVTITRQKKSLFVPYWTMTVPLDDTYDTYIYFGIEANEKGINKQDDGYRQLAQFTQSTKGKERLLTVRMIDSKRNARILENKSQQIQIAKEAVSIAKQYGFDGIVLDFELSALSFDSVIKDITSLITAFSTTTKQSDMTFAVTVFGDTYYRLRPYDIKAIGEKADAVYIMSYDFHKSTENPGPTFPFEGKQLYGYDFKTMIKDFIKEVPKEKLVIVIGMFGYDWVVDTKQQTTGPAAALSYFKANQLYGSGCAVQGCTKKRESMSGAITVHYVVGKEQHVVWYEDIVSSTQKQEYLREQGISQVGFWAHSFF